MGLEYDIYNHQNRTAFELGKGNWWVLRDNKWILYEPELFLDFVWEEMEYPVDDSMSQYYQDLGKSLYSFVRDTPPDKLLICGDTGDEGSWAKELKYKWEGSRYSLGEPENLTRLNELNEHLIKPRFSTYVKLTNGERKFLIEEGWTLRPKDYYLYF